MLDKVNAFIDAVRPGDILDATTAGVIARQASIDDFGPLDFLNAVAVLNENRRCSWIGEPIESTDPRVQKWMVRSQSAIDMGVVSNDGKARFQKRKAEIETSGFLNGKYLVE